MIGAPCSHLAWTRGKRERVRCSSLVDWPVYPRFEANIRAFTRTRN
jgi:hypothetical protein